MPQREQEFFDTVAEELQKKSIKPGLWARALAESEGDASAAQGIYIRYRVAELRYTGRNSAILNNIPFGLTRVQFAIGWVLLGLLFNRDPEVQKGLLHTVLTIASYTALCAMRIQNIGFRPRWTLVATAPWLLFLATIYFGLPAVCGKSGVVLLLLVMFSLLVLPKGFAFTRKSDKAMRIQLWVYGTLIAGAVLAYLFS